jgi:NADH-quinone oxidoreductase subunit G
VLQAVIGRGQDAREAGKAEAVTYAATKLKPLVGSIGVAVSPTASNEDLMAGLSFARDVLQAKSIFVTGRAPGAADKLLMVADKNPNRKGLEWIAKGLGLTLQTFDQLKVAVETGAVKALYAIGGEVPDAAFAETAAKLEIFVVQTTNEGPINAAAHVLLPTSTHVEDEGTFTQEGGITQRFRRAYPPRGDSQPHWKWAVDLAKEFGGSLAWSSSREVFRGVAPSVAELATYEWDKLAPVNVKKGISTQPTGADGRPPGWREFGPARVRGI